MIWAGTNDEKAKNPKVDGFVKSVKTHNKLK